MLILTYKSDMADEGENKPLLSSHAHRDNDQAGQKWKGRRSFVSSCSSCALSAATLPLVLFRRKKSDEVCRLQMMASC